MKFYNIYESLLSKETSQSSKYKVIPINSFEELKKRYENKTGYNTETQWDIMDKYLYERLLSKVKKGMYFVFEKDGWEKLNPKDYMGNDNPKNHNPYDEYGLSLICLMIDLDIFDSRLKWVVLRWNHIGDFDNTKIYNIGSEHAFATYYEMSKVLGFDVFRKILTCIDNLSFSLKNSKNDLNKTILDLLNDIAKTSPYKVTNKIRDIISSKFNLKSLTFDPKSLKDISFDLKIPNGIQIFEDNVFSEFYFLKSLKLPDSVIKLGDGCFDKCRNLKSIKLSKSLTELPNFCFSHCIKLKEINIPNSVIKLGYNCFDECKNLESVKLSNNLRYISHDCFYNCQNLKSIEIPDSVIEIDDECFSFCYNLQTIKLPKNLKKIPRGCFSKCHKLKSLELPESINEFEDECFFACTTLKTIKIPENIKIIPDLCFSYCKSLTFLEIPKFVEQLGYKCFESCKNLRTMKILGEILNFESNIFDGCSSLKEIICVKEATYNKFKELNLENVKISLNKNVK